MAEGEDPADGTLESLPALDGMEQPVGDRLADALILADGSQVAVTRDPTIGEILVGPLNGDLQPLDVRGIGLAWL